MIARFVSGAVFALFAYVLPTIGSPHLLGDPRLWVACLGAFALVAAQPTVSAAESARDRERDRGTALLIMGAAVATQLLATLELRYRSPAVVHPAVVAAGIALIVCGSALRVHAIRTLGRFFTATVRVVDDQQVVEDGAYRWVRHPSYLGAWLAILGPPVLFEAPLATLLAAIGMLLVYARRIGLEERALVQSLGAPYERYRLRTWAMLPGFW